MNPQPLRGQIETIFIGFYPTTKSGRPMIQLSNGMQASFFNTAISLDDIKDVKKGDSLIVEMEVDPFDRFSNKVTGVVL